MTSTKGLLKGEDGKIRCWWPKDDPLYRDYHDQEWGRPVDDDRRLFEKLCLEGFQSGLSWLTILRKREHFRSAFEQFDFYKIALFDEHDVKRLLGDKTIVRHQGKIRSTINNARQAIKLVDEAGSIKEFVERYRPESKNRPPVINYETMSGIGMTDESKALSKDLKNRGWTFVGPTTAYAFMQAMGLVNDHLEGCFCREEIKHSSNC